MEFIYKKTARQKAVEFIRTVTEGIKWFAKTGTILASPEERIERLTKCWEPCRGFNEENGKCKACGCSVKALTALARKKCPIGRWKKQEV